MGNSSFLLIKNKTTFQRKVLLCLSLFRNYFRLHVVFLFSLSASVLRIFLFHIRIHFMFGNNPNAVIIQFMVTKFI